MLLKTRNPLCLLVLFFILLSFTGDGGEIKFFVPKDWPKPAYNFSKNPVTTAGFQLGRQLFYDPLLSRDTTISCASCHLQATGFTHVDHRLSHGIQGRIGKRNSPALMNLAWSSSFMWDGGVNHLDMQPLSPVTSPEEMDETMENVVRKLNASGKYRRLFRAAFGDSVATGQKTLLALSQFVLMLNSYNSKYDKYIRKEPGGEFTEQELSGLAIFRKHCASCHAEPLFTDGGFARNGLPADPELSDIGRMKVTQNAEDSLKFKVPTLRNIQFTYPYMHDGRFKKLLEVVNHYTEGIQPGKIPDARLLTPIVLSHEEKIDLVAFLHTLTDRDFLFDPQFGFPKE
ncbi:MAG: cytochrome-c peroxidase [Saprospiraceae bacterium]|nr:cytochrome-c peroxidase [Saprospiraceae bacterium]